MEHFEIKRGKLILKVIKDNKGEHTLSSNMTGSKPIKITTNKYNETDKFLTYLKPFSDKKFKAFDPIHQEFRKLRGTKGKKGKGFDGNVCKALTIMGIIKDKTITINEYDSDTILMVRYLTTTTKGKCYPKDITLETIIVDGESINDIPETKIEETINVINDKIEEPDSTNDKIEEPKQTGYLADIPFWESLAENAGNHLLLACLKAHKSTVTV